MDEHREIAKQCLQKDGFRVREIQEADQERADLMVFDKAAVYLVEVKSKEASDEHSKLVMSRDGREVVTLERKIVTVQQT